MQSDAEGRKAPAALDGPPQKGLIDAEMATRMAARKSIFSLIAPFELSLPSGVPLSQRIDR
jgi:hypothetical protein